MLEIRVIGDANELRQAKKIIEQMFDVEEKSKFYDCRDDAQRKRLYIKANIKTATDKSNNLSAFCFSGRNLSR